MIWQLSREQLRSQKRYVVWTGAMLALTVALATFGALTVTPQQATGQISDIAYGQEGPWHLSVAPWTQVPGGPRDDDTVDAEVQTAIDEALQTAIDDGSDVVASRRFDLYPDTGVGGAAVNSTALTGAAAWDQILVSGTAPASGQAVVSAQYAQQHNVLIGDSVTFLTWESEAEIDRTVSGFSASPVNSSTFVAWAPGFYVAWADTDELEEFWGGNYTDLSWNTGDPALDGLATPQTGEPFFSAGSWSSSGGSTTTNFTILVGIALLLGMVAMAFAVGRSQAQARLKWVATARTLGATRRTIAAATIAETLVVGVFASVIGITLGYLGTAALLATARSGVASPALPTTVSMPWFVPAGALAFGLATAAIIGLIPAFWASRVSPVAALKPVNDVTEAEVSRRVSSRAVFLAWVAVTVLLAGLLSVGSQDTILTGLTILLGISAIALGIAVLVDGLRISMVRLGRALSVSGRPWAIAAGDALTARPRQAAIPAFIMAALIAGIVIAVGTSYLNSYLHRATMQGGGDFGWLAYAASRDYNFSTQLIWIIVAGLFVVALTTLAIAGSAQRAVGADAATREALGLSPASTRLAAGIQYGVPLGIGVLSGWFVGAFAIAWTLPGTVYPDYLDPVPAGDIAHALASTTLPVLAVITAGLVTTTLVGVTIALTTRTGSPLKQLQRVS